MQRGIVCALILAAALLTLAGCQSTQVMTAAAGTRLEAREVVALVYEQRPDPAIRNLPFSAGDIALTVGRMKARWTLLRPHFESGSIGVTADGLVAERDGFADQQLAALLRAENRDRQTLYAAAAQEVGHGSNDQFGDWMPYQRASFADEWVAQAGPGWWYRDERYNWRRTPGDPARPVERRSPR